MNRAIIIVMMDFLISSFMLFIDVGGSQTHQYQLNSRATPYEQARTEEQPAVITDEDIEEHFVEVYKDAYFDSLHADIAALSSKMERQEADLSRQLADSQSALAKSEDKKRELDAALDETTKENVSLKDRISEDDIKINTLESNFLKADARIHDLEAESSKMHTDYNKAREELSDANEKIVAQKEEIYTHKASLLSANEKIENQQHEIERKDTDISNANRKIAAQQHEIELKDANSKKLESDVQLLNQRVAEKDQLIQKQDLEKDRMRSEFQAERANLNVQNEHLRRLNEEHLAKLKESADKAEILSQEISRNQDALRRQADEFRAKYEEDSKEYKEILTKLVATSDEIRDRIDSVKEYNERLYSNLEESFKEQFREITGALAVAENNLRSAQAELQTAIISKNQELIDAATSKMDSAQSDFNSKRQELSDLDMRNAVASKSFDRRAVAEARIAFTFDLADKDWFTDKKNFSTHGLVVTLKNGRKVALAHAEPFGLMWSEYSDGLSKAHLVGRAFESGTPRSFTYSNFSILSNNPTIVAVPISSNVQGLKLHNAVTHPIYNLEQRNLKYYSQKSTSSQENMDNWKIDARQNKLVLPDRTGIIAGAKDWFNSYEGDFIVDSDGYLICMMISSSECAYIMEEDLQRTGKEFNIGNLDRLAQDASNYRRENK